jgi:hypothetical protein
LFVPSAGKVPVSGELEAENVTSRHSWIDAGETMVAICKSLGVSCVTVRSTEDAKRTIVEYLVALPVSHGNETKAILRKIRIRVKKKERI